MICPSLLAKTSKDGTYHCRGRLCFYKINVAFTVLNAPAVLQFPGKQCTGFSAFHNIIERLGPFPVGNDRVDSV